MEMEFQSYSTSPIMGLNDNLEFLGKVLHVQTENVWTTIPCILTQVFHQGRVIYSTKSEYQNEAMGSDNYHKIQALMHSQHIKVIERISKKQSMIMEQS